jgi:hypothetical protein
MRLISDFEAAAFIAIVAVMAALALVVAVTV